jgi:Lrp/AsnC family transcriptional regulator, leucine-responsive regulatory protein
MGDNMNKKDKLIIEELRKNARIPLTKLSKNTRIPISTIFERIKRHEEDIIIKYTSIIDFSKLGFLTRATIALKVNLKDREGLKNYLYNHPCVNSLFKINNGFDYMIEGVFRQVKDMEIFLEDLEKRFKIEEEKSFYIIEDYKREGCMIDNYLIME